MEGDKTSNPNGRSQEIRNKRLKSQKDKYLEVDVKEVEELIVEDTIITGGMVFEFSPEKNREGLTFDDDTGLGVIFSSDYLVPESVVEFKVGEYDLTTEKGKKIKQRRDKAAKEREEKLAKIKEEENEKDDNSFIMDN